MARKGRGAEGTRRSTHTYVSYGKELRTNRTYGRSFNGLHAHARAYTHYTQYNHYTYYTYDKKRRYIRYTHYTTRSPTSVDTTMASRSGSVMVGPKGSSMVTMLSAMLGLIAWRNRRTRSFRSLRSVQRFNGKASGGESVSPVGKALVWLLVQLHTFVNS